MTSGNTGSDWGSLADRSQEIETIEPNIGVTPEPSLWPELWRWRQSRSLVKTNRIYNDINEPKFNAKSKPNAEKGQDLGQNDTNRTGIQDIGSETRHGCHGRASQKNWEELRADRIRATAQHERDTSHKSFVRNTINQIQWHLWQSIAEMIIKWYFSLLSMFRAIKLNKRNLYYNTSAMKESRWRAQTMILSSIHKWILELYRFGSMSSLNLRLSPMKGHNIFNKTGDERQ